MRTVHNPKIWRHVRVTRRQRFSDLDLTPVMNLFMLLIPFLLISATFVEYAIVHSAVTEQAASRGEQLKPALIVEIHDDRYVVTSRTVDLKRLVGSGDRVAGSGKIVVEKRDAQELAQVLRKIKAAFPEEKEITLAPQRHTDYQLVISTMDAVREYREESAVKSLFPNIAFIEPPRTATPKPPAKDQP
jgi:biopolymer transport protein ExbD